MNIKDVEKLTGLSKPNIRYYEQEGLISPERGKNNYRVYSERDIALLEDIKKLRMIGIPVDSIRAYFQGEKDLSQLLKCRLGEIDSDAGLLQNQADICKKAIQNNVMLVSEISIDEKNETWQRRLAVFMRDDIVQHQLTRSEFNRDVLLFTLLGCGLALVTTFVFMILGNVDFGNFLHDDFYIVLVIVLVLGIAPVFTGNVQVHMLALFLSSIVNALLLWTLFSYICDYGLGDTLDAWTLRIASELVLLVYFGLLVLILIAWTISQLSPQLFRSVVLSILLSAIFTLYTYVLSALICGDMVNTFDHIIMSIILFLLSFLISNEWVEINKEEVSYTRYASLLTANKMLNIAYTFISLTGYSGSNNMRRGE